jgi:hypothetical protein
MCTGMQGIRLSCTVADIHSIRWIIYYKSSWQTPLHKPENGSGRIEYIHNRRTALHKHTDNHQPPAKQHTPLLVMVNLLLTLGYMAGIYWLSSIPGEAATENELLSGIILWIPPAIQNLAHIPLFGVLAWLWYLPLSACKKHDRLLFSTTFLLTTGFGIMDELHQLTVPGRYASLTDIALNTLGAGFAVWLISRPGCTTRQ